MIIRKAVITDNQGIAKTIAVMGYDADAVDVRRRLEKITAKDDHLLLVAVEGDEVIGFCHAYLRILVEVDDAVEIGGLAVLQEWQGKGVARQLIEGIEAWALSLGQKRIVLSSNITREQAHGFYEHLGYKKTKQQFAFDKNLE